MIVHKILGPPGTGKTHTLLELVERHLSDGIPPSRIAFVSYTKKAADEAAARAINKFGFTSQDLPYFRTLHSIAYRELGVIRGQLINEKDDEILGQMLGVRFTRGSDEMGSATSGAMGNRLRNIINFSKATKIELKQAWHEMGEGAPWYQLEQFVETERLYKQDTGKLDFSDMLDKYTSSCSPLPIDIAIIDEAQDLTQAQWAMARHALRHAKEVYIAGDDDQCIFEWNGADIRTFMGIKSDKLQILPHSYRLPRKIHKLADDITQRISSRHPKEFTPSDREGHIEYIHALEALKLDGEWMLLARNNCFLKDYEELCRSQGVLYQTKYGPSVNPKHHIAIAAWERLRKGDSVEGSWLKNRYLPFDIEGLDDDLLYTAEELNLHDMPIWHESLKKIPLTSREYYVTCMRNGQKLGDSPNIYIGTIHSVKGGEADNVLLRTDMTYKTSQDFDMKQDNEHRVFYVGVTRARENLYILEPQTNTSYQL